MKMKSYILYSKRILLLLLVIFSLVPCAVKNALFNGADSGYDKTHNKPRSTNQTSLCQIASQEEHFFSFNKKQSIKTIVEPACSAKNLRFIEYSLKLCDAYTQASERDITPKYILYKRLRIDIV